MTFSSLLIFFLSYYFPFFSFTLFLSSHSPYYLPFQPSFPLTCIPFSLLFSRQTPRRDTWAKSCRYITWASLHEWLNTCEDDLHMWQTSQVDAESLPPSLHLYLSYLIPLPPSLTTALPPPLIPLPSLTPSCPAQTCLSRVHFTPALLNTCLSHTCPSHTWLAHRLTLALIYVLLTWVIYGRFVSFLELIPDFYFICGVCIYNFF